MNEYELKLKQLEQELKAIDLYINSLKQAKVIDTAKIKHYEVKYRRTMIRYRTLIINSNEAA